MYHIIISYIILCYTRKFDERLIIIRMIFSYFVNAPMVVMQNIIKGILIYFILFIKA